MNLNQIFKFIDKSAKKVVKEYGVSKVKQWIKDDPTDFIIKTFRDHLGVSYYGGSEVKVIDALDDFYLYKVKAQTRSKKKHLLNSFTKKSYQEYVRFRQDRGMNYIANYQTWVIKHSILLELFIKKQIVNLELLLLDDIKNDNWDDCIKHQLIRKGKAEYWQTNEVLEKQISDLKQLLLANG